MLTFDGVTSCVSMYRYLKAFTDNVYYIYHQRSAGHGVKFQMDQIKDDTDLLIILDSSTNDADECKVISDKNIDVVIIDHHWQTQSNPYATIVNPSSFECKYPNKYLSGVGLVYKTLQVLDDKLGKKYADGCLDLVGIGMLGDQMKLNVLENRYLISQGMQNIKNPGLKAILELANIEEDKVDSNVLAFTIVPQINGAARLDQISVPIQLLLETDMKKCRKLAKKLKDLNEQRKAIQHDLLDSYQHKINDKEKIMLIIDENANSGFNGLVANDLSKQFHKPCFILKDEGDTLKGSGRSFNEFDTNKFFNESGLAIAAGHDQAHGVQVERKNLDKLRQYIEENIDGSLFDYKIEYDLELDASEITFDLVEEISVFNYLTGQGFPSAIFKVNELFVEDKPKTLGQFKDTKKIKCDRVDLMKFKTDKDFGNDIKSYDSLDVVGQLEINEWTNPRTKKTRRNLQILIEDYQIK